MNMFTLNFFLPSNRLPRQGASSHTERPTGQLCRIFTIYNMWIFISREIKLWNLWPHVVPRVITLMDSWINITSNQLHYKYAVSCSHKCLLSNVHQIQLHDGEKRWLTESRSIEWERVQPAPAMIIHTHKPIANVYWTYEHVHRTCTWTYDAHMQKTDSDDVYRISFLFCTHHRIWRYYQQH